MSNLSDNHSSSLDSSKSSNSSNSTGKSAVSINDGLLKERIEKIKADPHLTQSEKSFKIAQIKRSSKRVESHLRMTHREKVEQFNQKLSKLTEHFDIPKVGPG
ncbi:conserved protein, unknown function [Babesia microti strain RI]|uniref:Protein FAM32A n=1 Tax=Babesia microti (strain RI) TaxID=1133968 RepID=A0A1N6LYF8_BABMR|nr:conserved protein, unknown function [Babesia microti strain RI]SIO73902.1 conserved protein, unknown function [Babesia microti strain RI]|eukprot:XP_021337952.1 conserved protein, unknown function [Babesia microti strain RI]